MTPGADPSQRRVPGAGGAAGPGRRDTAAHLASRQRAAARARIIRRRRAVAVLAALALVAGIVAACNTLTSASSHDHPSSSSSSSSSTQASTTTTTLPASFGVGMHTFHFDETGNGVTHVGPTGSAVPGRQLTTIVRYPTLSGSTGQAAIDATPAKAGEPFPVIVFAHGFETEPSSYAGLLDAWVRAGFVVVSPVFPDENLATVTADGGLSNPRIASTLETDVYNEPGDIVYVLRQMQSITTYPWGSHLKGVMNLSDVALAGQSDGANVVAALSFASELRSLRSELVSTPKAVAVLSGSAWSDHGLYRGSPRSAALLQVQSDADGCNPPYEATDLYSAVQHGLPHKWFVTLLGADHLAPYEGTEPWASVVDDVTTKFFELELHWRPSTTSASAVVSAGTAAGAAEVTSDVNGTTIPTVSLDPAC